MASSVSHELEGDGHADDTMFRPMSVIMYLSLYVSGSMDLEAWKGGF
jgi:hypothetical protein